MLQSIILKTVYKTLIVTAEFQAVMGGQCDLRVLEKKYIIAEVSCGGNIVATMCEGCLERGFLVESSVVKMDHKRVGTVEFASSEIYEALQKSRRQAHPCDNKIGTCYPFENTK